MSRFRQAFLFAIAALAASLAQAQVTVTEAWARGTVPGQKATGVYMKLKSTEDVSLVNAASPVAGIVEIHEMVMRDNIMAMRSIDDVPLPAGKTVELKPGGHHVMLIDLFKPLAKGERVPVTLTFVAKGNKRTKLEIQAEVMAPGATPGHGHK